jgi:hypothetical protein
MQSSGFHQPRLESEPSGGSARSVNPGGVGLKAIDGRAGAATVVEGDGAANFKLSFKKSFIQVEEPIPAPPHV